MQEQRIRCPKCNWEPLPESRWQCYCWHVWNTFDTQGKCPSCGKVHKHTQCLACHEFSPHADWYLDLDDIDLSEILENENVETDQNSND